MTRDPYLLLFNSRTGTSLSVYLNVLGSSASNARWHADLKVAGSILDRGRRHVEERKNSLHPPPSSMRHVKSRALFVDILGHVFRWGENYPQSYCVASHLDLVFFRRQTSVNQSTKPYWFIFTFSSFFSSFKVLKSMFRVLKLCVPCLRRVFECTCLLVFHSQIARFSSTRQKRWKSHRTKVIQVEKLKKTEVAE